MVFQPGVVHGPETGDKSAQAARGRARTLALPALQVPDGIDLAEYAVLISEAARLVEVSQQSLNKSVVKGHLSAFQHEGRRYIRLDDLVECQAARRQQDAIHELDMRRASHQINVDHPISYDLIPPDEQCAGEWERCEICGPPTDEYERIGQEPWIAPPKAPTSPAKLRAIAKARAALAAKRAAG